jgi:TPR repeat protein
MIVGLLLSASASAAGTLDDAMAAFNRQDFTGASQLLEPLAVKNDPRAQFYLGMIYLLRTDGRHDYADAAKWFLKAAEQDYTDAQYNLGVLLLQGLGVSQNYMEAYKGWIIENCSLESSIWFPLATCPASPEAIAVQAAA